MTHPRRSLPFPGCAGVLLVLGLSLRTAAAREPVVIVNLASSVDALTREDVINIFMGRQRRLPPDLVALPMEQAEPAFVRLRFYRLLVGKDLAEINTYWARLSFSGQAQPPRQARSAKETLDWVAQNPGAIAVVDGDHVDHRVRVVYSLRP